MTHLLLGGIRFLLPRFTYTTLKQNALQNGLTVIGIALGVAVFLAIHLANHSVLQTFEEGLETITGKASLEIRANSEETLPESVLETLKPLQAIEINYTPIIDGTALLFNVSTPETVQVIGIDPFSDRPFRSYQFNSQEAQPSPGSSLSFLEPNTVFVGEALATRNSLHTGQTITLLIHDQEKLFHIGGILSSTGLGKAYSGNLILMDIHTAQLAFEQPGQINRIDLMPSKEQAPELQAWLQAKLDHLTGRPGDLLCQAPEQRSKQVENMLHAFQTNLTALSFISMLVGMFLIYNTMSISILRRRPEIGILRALGMTRTSIFILFFCEVIFLAFSGTGLGLLLGIGMAQGALESISKTVDTLYVAQSTSQLSIEASSLLWIGLSGILLTLLAALPPLLEASRVAPTEILRRRSEETQLPRRFPLLLLLGLLFLLLAGWAARQPAVSGFPLFGHLAALLSVIGISCWMPPILNSVFQSLLWINQHWLNRFSLRIGVMSLKGMLGRTSVSVASLMVGIAMMISLATMVSSFRETVLTWVDQTVRADFLLKPAAKVTSRLTGSLPIELVNQIQALPETLAVDGFFEMPLQYKGQATHFGVGNMDILLHYGHLRFTDNRSHREVLFKTQQTPNGVLITESFASKHHLSVGDSIQLPRFKAMVTGIYYDYTSESGYIIADSSLYQKYYGPLKRVSTIAIFLRKGISLETYRQKLLATVPQSRLIISSQREVREEVLKIFDNTFAITYALHIIAILVALLGIFNTLLTLVLESRTEFAILRYLGASCKQIQKVVIVQSILLGFLGFLSGLGLGLLLSVLLIEVINKQSFGWSIGFHLPLIFLLQSFGLVMGAAFLAGWLPAKWAAQHHQPHSLRQNP